MTPQTIAGSFKSLTRRVSESYWQSSLTRRVSEPTTSCPSSISSRLMMLKRSAILFLLFGLSFVLITALHSGSDVQAAKNRVNTARIPMQFGDWVGESSDIEDETVQVLNATSFINRLIRIQKGRVFSTRSDLGKLGDDFGCSASSRGLLCRGRLEDRRSQDDQGSGRFWRATDGVNSLSEGIDAHCDGSLVSGG